MGSRVSSRRTKTAHHKKGGRAVTAQQPGKCQTKAAEVRWVFALMSSEVFPVDQHGRQVGKAEKVRDIQEAHDICEARNYPERGGKT